MIGRICSSAAALTLCTALLVLLDSSCAKMVPVPDADYMEARQSRKGKYLVRTRDNRVLVFDRYQMTDSTLVILRVTASGEGSGTPSPATAVQTPIAVPWRDVVSLERYDYWNAKTWFGIGAGLAVLAIGALTLAVVAFAAGLSGLN